MKTFKLYNSSINKPFNAELTGCQTFWSFRYNIEIFYFDNRINFKKFLNALNQALHLFPFLFCRINKKDGNYYYHSNTNSYVELEYEDRMGCNKNDAKTAELLPANIDQRMFRNTPHNDLPVSGFKFTLFQDGITIGFYINHAYIDQSSIVCFFKVLSNIYENKDQRNITPKLIDIETTLGVNAKKFNNLDQVENWSYNVGLKNKPNFNKIANNDNNAITPPTCDIELEFNIDAINKIKNISATKISTNDVISAISMKLHCLNQSLDDKANVIFTFPANMRRFCGLDDNTIGSLISMNFIKPLNVGYIRTAHLEELAQLNRTTVNKINMGKYKDELAWFAAHKELNLTMDNYRFTPGMQDVNTGLLIQSNWLNFDYQSIKFGDSKLTKIDTEILPTRVKTNKISLVVISFKSHNNVTIPFVSKHLSTEDLVLLESFKSSTDWFFKKISERN